MRHTHGAHRLLAEPHRPPLLRGWFPPWRCRGWGGGQGARTLAPTLDAGTIVRHAER